MVWISWIFVIILGFGVGYFLVNYLTIHPSQMNRYLAITLLCCFALLALIAARFDGIRLLYTGVAALIGFVSGYFWQTRRVLYIEDNRLVPEIIRQKDYPGLGHTSIIYFTHGEPETYNPIGWLNQFREFDEQGIKFVPFFARPLFI